MQLIVLLETLKGAVAVPHVPAVAVSAVVGREPPRVRVMSGALVRDDVGYGKPVRVVAVLPSARSIPVLRGIALCLPPLCPS